MAQVKVWNDNKHAYKEHFRDTLVQIPAGGFILMEEGDAHLFKGQFSPIMVDHDGQPDPRGYKMIRVEKLSDAEALEAVAESEQARCHACSYEASSAKDLEEHCASSHSELLVRDEEAEKEVARRKRAQKAG